jgi:hypothetical protein
MLLHEYDVERVFATAALLPIGGAHLTCQKGDHLPSQRRIRLVNFDWTEKNKEFKSRGQVFLISWSDGNKV